jgi:hypothetical protein
MKYGGAEVQAHACLNPALIEVRSDPHAPVASSRGKRLWYALEKKPYGSQTLFGRYRTLRRRELSNSVQRIEFRYNP